MNFGVRMLRALGLCAVTTIMRTLKGAKRSLVICTPQEARGSILRDCNHLWRVQNTPQRHRANKGSICGENAPSLLKASLLFEHGKRLVEASAWKVCSANFALTQF